MMLVKRYRADNVSSALKMVKADLGPDAVILRTRRVRTPGLIGWFRQPQLEVAAAADGAVRPSGPAAGSHGSVGFGVSGFESSPETRNAEPGGRTAVEAATEHRQQPPAAGQEQLTQFLARLEQAIARLAELRAEFLSSLRQEPVHADRSTPGQDVAP